MKARPWQELRERTFTPEQRERQDREVARLVAEMPRGRCTTVVVGPDGRVFDLCKEPFPIREATKDQSAYFPVNAYTVKVEE